MKKKILIISSGRADFYLLENLMVNSLKKKINSNLLLIGSHFIKGYGKVKVSKEIKNKLINKVQLNLQSDNPQKILFFVSKLINKISKKFQKINPNLIVVLGDRYETLTVVYTAALMKIPVAHIHGGEITKGAIDDNFRHAITKMSHLHFTSTATYKKRIVQLGEKKSNVHNVGSLGVENLKRVKFYDKKEIENKIGIKIKKKLHLVTFHPVTLDKNEKIDHLLSALSELKDTTLIFTAPNIDPDNINIIKKINKFNKQNKNSIFLRSLGQKLYFSCLKISDGVIGNSSSGIIEAPSLKIPTLNIGIRQKGRVMSNSIISCANNKLSIQNALQKIKSKKFLSKIKNEINPYYQLNTSEKIINVIKKTKIDKLILKSFYDIKL
jgi:UDP-hydrolysing UDP-N-acetyl-D-glucosamine 2-epimerase